MYALALSLVKNKYEALCFHGVVTSASGNTVPVMLLKTFQILSDSFFVDLKIILVGLQKTPEGSCLEGNTQSAKLSRDG